MKKELNKILISTTVKFCQNFSDGLIPTYKDGIYCQKPKNVYCRYCLSNLGPDIQLCKKDTIDLIPDTPLVRHA